MNFTTVSRVQQTIRAGDEVEFIRGSNRVKINNAANGVPQMSPEECKKLGLKISVNWGELMVLLSQARRQYMSAFWSQQNFFRVRIPEAPDDRQSEWEAGITEKLNRIMRRSLEYFEVHRSKWAAVAAHGIGPTQWRKRDHWRPDFLAIEDLRIPTDTTLDFQNLNWFATRHIYTPFELLNDAFNNKKKNPWNTRAVGDILKNYKQINFQDASTAYDWETTPEKLAELVKQDGGYYASDAMPGIPLWHFYFEDNTEEDNRGWFLRIVPEQGTVRGTPSNDAFLWESDQPVAPNWKQLLHCQYRRSEQQSALRALRRAVPGLRPARTDVLHEPDPKPDVAAFARQPGRVAAHHRSRRESASGLSGVRQLQSAQERRDSRAAGRAPSNRRRAC